MAFMKPISEKAAALSTDDDNFESITIDYNYTDVYSSTGRSILLIDAKERIHIPSPELFCKLLKCDQKDKIKVVTIFGNTGDGKSHTMNHAFFKGEEVFKTSPQQNSCTLGVYAAMQSELGVLCLDTEGLLSTSSECNRRMRMLLKILAISDIVIYRTRSERIHRDMFNFLGNASKAFRLHFSNALQSLSMHGSANLGPAVIIFHETVHTQPLQNTIEASAEEKLRETFALLNYDIKAFSSLRYVGSKTLSSGNTNFSKLISALSYELDNTTVRSARSPGIVMKALLALNKKFSSEIDGICMNPFPEEYFTCPVLCVSCNKRCQHSMGHESEPHLNSQPCHHQHQLENKVELCKSCYTNGRETIVSRIDGWTYSGINCPHCGEIASVFKYWNDVQDCDAICTKIIHFWNDSKMVAKGSVNSGQMVLDKMSYLYETITNISSQPTGIIKGWCADMVAPKYWKLNSEIIICFACKKNFEKTGLLKHHCRGCGEGFCDACTQHRLPVPARNWFDDVRICNDCYLELLKDSDYMSEPVLITPELNNTEESDVTIRKYSETIYNTVSTAAWTAMECTKELIKDTARPDYWVPDAEAVSCHICKIKFGTAEELALVYVSDNTPKKDQKAFNGSDCRRHHCRKCGQGVCAECSLTRIPVPDRGWLYDVRVCDECVNDMSTEPSSSSSNDSSHQHLKVHLDNPYKTYAE